VTDTGATSILDLVRDPGGSGAIWAAGASAGGSPALLHSSDHGQSWSGIALPDLGPGRTELGALALDPTDPQRLWAGGDVNASISDPLIFPLLLASDDGGHSWEQRGSSLGLQGGPLGEGITAMEVDPHDAQVLLVGSWSGLRRSTDGGATWHHLPEIADVVTRLLAVPGAQPPQLWALVGLPAFAPSVPWMSNDEGATWHAMTTGLQGASVLDLALDVSSNSAPRLLAATDGRSVMALPLGSP
jgi:hypothetical protein